MMGHIAHHRLRGMGITPRNLGLDRLPRGHPPPVGVPCVPAPAPHRLRRRRPLARRLQPRFAAQRRPMPGCAGASPATASARCGRPRSSSLSSSPSAPPPTGPPGRGSSRARLAEWQSRARSTPSRSGLFSRNFQPILDASGVVLAQIQFQTPAAGQLITYVGAGIYEEVLFRLGLFSIAVLAAPPDPVPNRRRRARCRDRCGRRLRRRTPHRAVRRMADRAGGVRVPRCGGIDLHDPVCDAGVRRRRRAHAGYDVLVGVTVGPAA